MQGNKQHAASFEWLLTARLEMILIHREREGRLSIDALETLRTTLDHSLAQFPYNPLFLRLFADTERKFQVARRLQIYFQRLLRNSIWSNGPIAVQWLFAIFTEISRAINELEQEWLSSQQLLVPGEAIPPSTVTLHPRLNLAAIQRIRRMFEIGVDSFGGQGRR